MITACELCTKITVEKALQEEKIRIKKMEAVEKFAEEVLSPILSALTEIPDNTFIGYRYHNGFRGLYRKIGEWQNGKTCFGNPMKERSLIKPIDINYDFAYLDYELLNRHLINFGFQVFVKTESFCMQEFSTSTPDRYSEIDKIYLSIVCPNEEKVSST